METRLNKLQRSYKIYSLTLTVYPYYLYFLQFASSCQEIPLAVFAENLLQILDQNFIFKTRHFSLN